MAHVDLGDLALLALAFFLVVASVALAVVGARAAQTLGAATEALRNVDREAIPALQKTNVLLDHAAVQMERVDQILATATDGVEAADRTVRRVSDVVSKPFSRMAEASAYANASASSFRARRQARREEPT
jgi:uncharacterized protein YoxC